MARPRLDRNAAFDAQSRSSRGRPITGLLVDSGALTPREAVEALAQSAQSAAPLAHIVEKDGLASPEAVLEAQALRWGALRVTRAGTPPDASLSSLLPPEFCLAHGVLPWRRIGETLVLATARPDDFDTLLDDLPPGLGPVTMAVALESDIHAEIAARHGARLALQAESTLPADLSCRDLNQVNPRKAVLGAAMGIVCIALLALAPKLFFAGVVALAALTLLMAQVLKLAAIFAAPPSAMTRAENTLPQPLPSVTMLVPLYREETIASSLVHRLSRLSYPKSRLDIVLVLEASDTVARAALAETRLPPWMRVIEVPSGSVQTKPRALNYALRFSRSDIVGVYDAEDAPAPDQIERIAAHFARSPPQVACLQGILDFYNPRANWLSRCFAIEYAGWFRILLPGLSRLGFAVPLGGTTLFFRREALDRVGGWDAHNVTEDADLGVRLARFGYRTELVATVTREEANNRLWPWVKQRSRWLKGYMITWLVHMRDPARLWRELGAWRFLGVQLIFLTAIAQVLLAPVLWSFWLVLLGMPHPIAAFGQPWLVPALIGLFLAAEAISLSVSFAAVARSPHSGLLSWVPMMLLYFPLGVLAVYKALWEVFTKPFYWEKTEHGRSQPDDARADLPTDP